MYGCINVGGGESHWAVQDDINFYKIRMVLELEGDGPTSLREVVVFPNARNAVNQKWIMDS